ncbi:hypothetical protein [Pseudomonas sp. NMS19W]|uniref:hypothetical protein n=1 Tax=Pseudomonas sp. NMS19W TaxID=3079768 RepID=UPI003F658F1C
MAREEGKRYSKCIFSGYKSQQELKEYLSRNYQQAPAEIVEVEGSNDFVVYLEDEKGEEYTDDRALGMLITPDDLGRR